MQVPGTDPRVAGSSPRSTTQLSGAPQQIIDDSFGAAEVPPQVRRLAGPLPSFPAVQGPSFFSGVTTSSEETGQYEQWGQSYTQATGGVSMIQAGAVSQSSLPVSQTSVPHNAVPTEYQVAPLLPRAAANWGTLPPDQLQNSLPGNYQNNPSAGAISFPTMIPAPVVATMPPGQVVVTMPPAAYQQQPQVIVPTIPPYQAAPQPLQAAQPFTDLHVRPFPTNPPQAGYDSQNHFYEKATPAYAYDMPTIDPRMLQPPTIDPRMLQPAGEPVTMQPVWDPFREGLGHRSQFAEDFSNMALPGGQPAIDLQPVHAFSGQAYSMGVANQARPMELPQVTAPEGPDWRSLPSPGPAFNDPFRDPSLPQPSLMRGPPQTLQPSSMWPVGNRNLNQQPPHWAPPPDEDPAEGKAVTGTDDGELGCAFYIYGFFVFAMLVMIPVWDGLSLLKDPVWMYMAGDVLLHKVLIACVASVPILFIFTVFLLKSCSRRQGAAQMEQTMFGAALLFILLLGATLVTISEPMTREAMWSKQQFLNNCETGLRTRPLYVEYQALQALRTTPACANLTSVEQCSGFKATPSSLTLQKFETYLNCAGFCFYPKLLKEATNASHAPSSLYPPALFTDANLQGSCSAMAARDMESYVSDMSNQLMYEGFFLIGAAVLQGFMMMFAGSNKRDLISKKKLEYGTTADSPYATSGTFMPSPVRQRAPYSRV